MPDLDAFLRDRARALEQKVTRLEYGLRCITTHPARTNESRDSSWRAGFEEAAQLAERALTKEDRQP